MPSRAPRSRAPGPSSGRLLGQYDEMRRDPLGLFLHLMHVHGDIARFRLANLTAHLVCHPEQIRQVLQDDGTRWGKDSRGYKKLKLVVGDGLLTSEGAFWKKQRRIAQPAFHRDRVAALGSIMTGAAEELVERWGDVAREGAAVDVALEMARMTLIIAGRALMGTDLADKAKLVGGALAVMAHDIHARMTGPFDFPLAVPTPRNVRLREAIRTLDDIVRSIIEARRQRGTADRIDLLSMLMDARDEETGERMDDGQLRDEVMTMLLAGHETTANALTWTWHLLGQSPTAVRKLHGELRTELGGRAPTVADLPRLPYCRMVIEESMRLFPPAWVIGRTPLADERLGGYEMPAGSIVFVSPYATHRHAGLWPNPDEFDPERFSPARSAERDRFAYIPFGAGPHVCIGQSFAMTEMHLALATIAQRFELHAVPGRPPIPEALVTIRTRSGLWMTLEQREAAAQIDVARAVG